MFEEQSDIPGDCACSGIVERARFQVSGLGFRGSALVPHKREDPTSSVSSDSKGYHRTLQFYTASSFESLRPKASVTPKLQSLNSRVSAHVDPSTRTP